MAKNDYPLINGVYHSWAEVQLVFLPYGDGIFRTADFNAVSFTEKLEPGQVKGQGIIKRGTTIGEYSAEGSFSMLLNAHIKFLEVLARIARTKKIPVGAVQFSMAMSWKAVPGAPIVKAALAGCRIKERGFDGSPSPDATVVETPIDVTMCRVNDVSLGEIPK